VVEEVRREVLIPHTLFVFGAYGIGKERVYMSVAQALNMKVHVDSARYRMIQCYEQWTADMKARITTKALESILWVVPMTQINFHSFDKILLQRPDCKRVIAFQPTGWTHNAKSSTNSALSCKTNKGKHKIYSVPYSEHSSFSELIDCLQILRPHIIVPTVNTSEAKVKEQLELLRKSTNY
jgi:DNA cross-link repair 1A protein